MLLDADGVERCTQGDAGGVDAACSEAGHHGIQASREARERHVVAVIDGRDANLVGQLSDGLSGDVLGRCGGHHVATTLHVVRKVTEALHQRQALVHCHEAGGHRRSDLADTMAHHRHRLHAPRPEEIHQRHLHGVDAHLAHPQVAQPRLRLGPRQLSDDGPAREALQALIHAPQAVAERSVRGHELRTHARPRGAGTREGERDPGLSSRSACDAGAGAGAGGRKLVQRRGELLVRRAQRDGAELVARPAVRGRVAHVLHAPRGGAHRLSVGLGHGRQRVARVRRHGQRVHDVGVRVALAPGCSAVAGSWRAAQHRVRVGAAEAEGVHAGELGAPRLRRPRLQLCDDAHVQLVKVDEGVGVLEVERRRHLVVAHGQAHFDEARHAGTSLHVPDVGLHGTHGKGHAGWTTIAQHRAQCPGLDGVTSQRPSAVSLHVLHVARPHARHFVGAAQHALLLRLVRRGDGRAASAVGVDAAA